MKRMLCGILMICMMVSVAFADNYSDFLEKAENYNAAGDVDHAVASYHLAQEIDSSRVDAFYGEALLLFSRGDYEDARALVQKALQVDPLFPDAWTLMCRIDVAKNDIASFESNLLYAEVCDADTISIAADIAVMYAESGMYEKAIKYFENVSMEALSDEQKALYKRSLIANGDREKAEALGFTTAGIRNEKLDNAFKNDHLVLKKVEVPKIDINDFEFPDDLWEAIGADKPDDIHAYLEEFFSSNEPQLLSIAPTGNSRIYSIDGAGVGYYNGKYHVLYPSKKRGVPDEYGNLEKYFQVAFQNNQMLGNEGVIYSSDGRYAAIYNIRITMINGKFFTDPIIIDLSTGEMILTATYDNKPMIGILGAVTTACFSSDNRYFYYILYGNTTEDRCALYRYDLNSSETELCCSIPYFAYYPYLSETEAGAFIIVEDQTKTSMKQSVLLISQSDGNWKIERNEFSLDMGYWFVNRLLYSKNSGFAFAVGNLRTLDLSLMFMVIRPDEDSTGLNSYHAISKESKEIIDITEDEYLSAIQGTMDKETMKIDSQLIPFALITKAVLSPDGHYAMLHTREGNGEAHLYLMELSTFQLREVKGLNAIKIPVGALAGKYKPIIEWNSDTLIIYCDGEILTYQFDFE